MRFAAVTIALLALLPAASSTAVPARTLAAKLDSRLADLSRAAKRVRVVVETEPGRIGAVASTAARLGARVEARYGRTVQVQAPLAVVRRLAADADVTFVRPPLLHVPAAVTGQEVQASGAALLHSAGVTGQGLKIAVIDIGFAGLADAKASGDLPADTLVESWCGLANRNLHGTAVAEIVHDMAPDAQLYLLCIDSEATLGKAVDYVINQDIPLINHSIAWLNGGRGDGVNNRLDRASPDDIARKAYDRGILWIGAAGNFGQSHWSGPFSDPDRDSWQNFAQGDEGNRFTVPAATTACAALSWDEWPLSDEDFDLYLLEVGTGRELASSRNMQRPSSPGTPAEEACFTADAHPVTAYAAIKNLPPAVASRLDLFVTAGTLQYSTPQGSVAQPAESPWVLATGAICWQGNIVRPYSSQGPTIDGRVKPDLVAYDGLTTRTFGPSSGCGNGFLGTSAATPVVTGAAALVLQQQPELMWRPAQLMPALGARTADLGGSGKDNLFGWGRLCLSSCAAPPPPPPPPPPPGPPPPPPPPPLRLALAAFVTTPRHSTAGKPFAAGIAVRRTDTGARVTSGKVSCAAKAGGKRLRVVSSGFRKGMARCSWRLPANSRGKLLRGAVGLTFRGMKIRRSFVQRIG